MKTRDELLREFDRLMELDMLEEASQVLDQIEPISREELNAILDAAPYDDEPVSPAQRRRLDEAHAALERGARQRVG